MVSSDNDNIVDPRIKTIRGFDIYPKYEDGDGPYESLKELKENSVIFKKLNRTDPETANRISRKENIIHIKELVEIQSSTQESLGNAAFDILSHVTSGKINNNMSFGVHLFNPKFHRIEKVTKDKNKHGVWEAKISILDPKSRKWVSKDAFTTFFPLHWNMVDLLLKMEIAFMNRVKIDKTPLEGYTDCGIKVIFIEKKGRVITVFPLYV